MKKMLILILASIIISTSLAIADNTENQCSESDGGLNKDQKGLTIAKYDGTILEKIDSCNLVTSGSL